MTDDGQPDADLFVPIMEERATISKETVETGRVRISTHVEEHHALVREDLRHEDVRVERVPVNRIVAIAPVVRREGDTMIYPIVEETLVVEKRLLLKEEIHVIRTSRLETFEQDVTLRAMHADVQRSPTPNRQD